MRKDSPVLNALEKNPNLDLVACRNCGAEFHQIKLRLYRWGAHGYCSKKCWEEAKTKYLSSKQKNIHKVGDKEDA